LDWLKNIKVIIVWIKSKRKILVILMLILMASIASGAYVGPEKCKTCHAEKYTLWKNSLHSKSIVDAKDAITGGYPVPDGVNPNDLKYTWAGKWKVRWVNNSGYVITGDAVQYNVVEKKFVAYESGKIVGYDCGPCHTTGYDAAGTMFTGANAYNSGTWKLPGVTCEQCHGEGSEHVKAPSKTTIMVDRTAEACDNCHGRTDASIGVTTTSFDPKRRHRVQYNDFSHSAKYKNGMSCINCHNPHETTDPSYADLGTKYDKEALAIMKPAVISYYKGTDNNAMTSDYLKPSELVCEMCHLAISKLYPDAKKVNLKHGNAVCLDCHMAKSRKTATAWDERSHSFMVDDKFNYSLAKPYSNYPDLTCKPCHTDMDFNKVTLSSALHSPTKVAETTASDASAKTPGFELFFAISAILVVVLAKRR